MNTGEFFRPDSNDRFAQRIAYLINGYNLGNLTASEHRELDQWVTTSFKNQQLFEEMTDPANLKKWMQIMETLDPDAALERIKNKTGMGATTGKFRPIFKRPYYWLAAAVIAGLAITGIYRFLNPEVKSESIAALPLDIAPGGRHARLTLASGSQILLDTVHSKIFFNADGAQILKDSTGLLYSSGAVTETQQSYNELTTPPGGEYAVRLSDGTRVWLNASSTLKYPLQFSDSVRQVELTGEAYFEVSKDADHPFIVASGTDRVRVLGTHFNVNAYPDNARTIVTLAEGSVKLNGSAILKPGQQGEITRAGRVEISAADVETNMAWKNGLFIFKMTTLDQIMQQVAHWYDARIVYQDHNTDHFSANIPRDVPVSQLLHLLEATGQVHFKIEGRTITVLK